MASLQMAKLEVKLKIRSACYASSKNSDIDMCLAALFSIASYTSLRYSTASYVWICLKVIYQDISSICSSYKYQGLCSVGNNLARGQLQQALLDENSLWGLF